MVVGALRPPVCPRIPVETAALSVKPCSGAWHDAQATVLSAERRLSKYSSLPSSTLSAEYGLSAGHGTGRRPSGAVTPGVDLVPLLPLLCASAALAANNAAHTTRVPTTRIASTSPCRI